MKKEIKRITCMCGLCGKTHDIPVLQYEDNMQIKDKEVWYLKTVYYCKNMDEEYCPEEIMDENLMSAREAYRRENGLLSAKSIQHIREKYGLSQEEYDKLLGFEDGTTKKWETDSLPTRQIKNTGSKTQYYIEHTHTPIIDRDTRL